ncbi:Ribonuclease H [Abeliophyllum distichum]|uniref:Ribonuclease H n=1 Tax=Abeliophyllum distichum TaxID=126358 RepID=A0ABD1RT58_9LAMI
MKESAEITRGDGYSTKGSKIRVLLSSIKKNLRAYAKKCKKCQKIIVVLKLLAENFTPTTSPRPFAEWRIDVIGSLMTGRDGIKFAVIAVDYFTKWCKAEHLAKITEENT